MNDLKAEIEKKFPTILINEPLFKYSTFKIGGAADFFYKITETSELTKILRFAKSKKLPIFILGGGSNVLFDDKGFRGLVIKIETGNIKVKNEKITADSGVLVSKLIKTSIENGLSGLEKWTGLPGTVGGAVRGNAGCNGLETKDILVNAKILNQNTAKIRILTNEDLKFEYRNSKIKKSKEIILSATFKLEKSSLTTEQQKEIIKKTHKSRTKKQPFGATTGSFFKNPCQETPAGMLIDQAGLKGKIIGKARISEKHANFFLNMGGATSKDIISLAKLVQEKVYKKFKIHLEEEVQIISEKGTLSLSKVKKD